MVVDGSDCGADARSTFRSYGAHRQELHVKDSQCLYRYTYLHLLGSDPYISVCLCIETCAKTGVNPAALTLGVIGVISYRGL